jgi:hypothetical protein
MEDYIRRIVKEYEKSNADLMNGATNIDFRSLKRLKEFTGSIDKKKEDGFEKSLASPHDEVIKIISSATFLESP